MQRERRTDTVRLAANPTYWNRARGPRLAAVEFRNDVPLDRALDLVCESEGEVDLVTEVPAACARRVSDSPHARLVAVDAFRVLAGAFDRDSMELPLQDVRARRALNLAIDRAALVEGSLHGHARPLSGLTPNVPLTGAVLVPDRLRPYPHDPSRAAELWRAASGSGGRVLRLAVLAPWAAVAAQVAAQLESALPLTVDVEVLDAERECEVRRRLAAKDGPQGWHVLLLDQGAQSADAPPLELHRAFAGRTGEFRSGPVISRFEELYARMAAQTGPVRQALAANWVDRYTTRQALALFLVAPQALYAVNRQVDFRPYRTTFELADTSVNPTHWSRR